MQIKLKEITIGELADGYQDNGDDGVVGYGGKLDIRPPYQREFIYKDKQRDAVIDTVAKGFPLNVMYWAVRDDGNFEVIDGQQRTISVCQFVSGSFSFNKLYFYNLQDDKRRQVLNYKLMVYLCSGTDSEKLQWFKTINIAGEILTPQELRNAVYAGSWTADAKRYFSKTGCVAYSKGNKYLNGTAIRQEYLETAIKWMSKGKIEEYMGRRQHEPEAKDLWEYFEKVIDWVESVFPKYRKEMKGVEWGLLYNDFGNEELNPGKIETEVSKLMEDEDVTNKKGIYTYVLTRDEKHLSIRAFTDKQKREAYERQKGICRKCRKKFELSEMEADHIKPWIEGRPTTAENCQMLCKDDNRRKSAK